MKRDTERIAIIKVSQIPPSKAVREWFKNKFKKGTKILYTHLPVPKG